MSDKEVIGKILKRYVKNNWLKKITYLTIFWVIIAWVAILEPFFMKEIISIIEIYLQTDILNLEVLILIFIYWWIFIILINILKVIYWKIVVDTNLNNYKKNHFIESEKILSMSYSNYLWKKQWKLFKIYDRWLDAQIEFIYFLFEDFIISISSVLIAIIILFLVDIRMAIITLLLMPIILYVWFYINLKTRKIQDEINNQRDEAFWYFWDWINNLALLKTLSLKKQIIWLIKLNINKADKAQRKVMFSWILWDIYTQLIIMISRFLVLGFWIYFLINWTISFALLFLFLAYIPQIYYPIWFLFKRFWSIQRQISSLRVYLKEFWNLELDIDTSNSKNVKNFKWNIKFDKVNFWYTEDKKILKQISFNIEQWKKIAFVWNTWAWKSTIISLLFRFWDCNSWEITLDWKNIKTIKKDSLRKHIWIVMQDNSLFNMSIKDNLIFAKPGATCKEIELALKKAEADFVFSLKDWIDTLIWERWLKLSGWEKQRLSIARLFIKNPEILILDEATSALDNKTEKLVQKALDKLMEWRTSIVIAHRLSTIQNADKIFMLEDWKIVEEWNYEELMYKKWKFHELANPEHLILN